MAELLGIPVGTVKSRLKAARDAFRAEAARQGFEFSMEDDDDGPP